MGSDLIGRRRALEERLDRARALETFIKEQTDILAEITGMSIDEIDGDGSFRATLIAVASVADRRAPFDVVVSLPDAPFAIRIQHLGDGISAEVLIQRGGPFEPLPAAEPEPVRPSGRSADQVASDLAALLWQGVNDLPS